MLRKVERYLYVFDNQVIIATQPNKPKPNRILPYSEIQKVIWNYAQHKKNKELYIKSLTIEHCKSELKYYADQDILIALKRIIAKFVFQSKIQDEYEAQNTLGEGSYAVVVNLRHIHTNFMFAGKIIDKKKLNKIDHGLSSVQNEIQIMRALSPHSQLVNLHEVYDGDNNIYLIMDLCKGDSLYNEIKKRNNLFSKQEIKTIISNLLSSVEYIHSKGVMHRDLKPENILFQTEGDLSTLKLADFGLSAFSKQFPYLYPKCGTPGYVAPEVANLIDKQSGYSVVCDIFSIGAIFHLLLLGEGIFPGKGHLELLKLNKQCDIQPTLQKYSLLDEPTKDLMFKMLRKHPNHRPQAHECLEHAYFMEGNQQFIQQDDDSSSYMSSKLQIEDSNSIVMQEPLREVDKEINIKFTELSLQKDEVQ